MCYCGHLFPLYSMLMNEKPAYRLLCLLTYAAHTGEEEQQAKQAAAGADWAEFYRLAAFNKIIPVCYWALRQWQLWEEVPPELWASMEKEALEIQEKNELRNQEAAVFLKAFKANQIPVALIKGVAFGETVYRNPHYKKMNDIDILVKPGDMDRIYAIYDTLGYHLMGKKLNCPPEYLPKVSHSSAPVISNNFNCIIGTHWGLKNPLSPYRIDPGPVWSSMSSIVFGGVEVQVLSPENNLHHLCLHLGQFKISLRDVMDLYNLLRVYRQAFNWEGFYQIVSASGSENPVHFSLTLSQFIFPLPEAEIFLKRIERKVSYRYKKSARWKTRSMTVFLHLHSNHIKTIQRALLFFESTAYFPEKFRFFIHLFCSVWLPPKAEVIRMSGLYRPGRLRLLWARLVIPFKILRVIAGDIGWSITCTMMVRAFIDIIIALFRFPFIRKSKTSLRAFAESLGIPFDQLKKLKDLYS